MNELRHVDLSTYLSTASEAECEIRRLFSRREKLVIFDVGACEGEDTVRYARCFPRARVFAFEPLPANQQLVRSNLTLHNVPNAELVPVALSNQKGEAAFHVSSGRPTEEFAGQDWNYGNKSSSLLAPAHSEPMYGWVRFDETIAVPTDTLDGFCRERSIGRIAFLHMDVQGAESLVLQGAKGMISATTAVWLEVSDRELYRGQKLRGEIEAFMRKHGFWLAFELRREIEGDQFYVNIRHARTWPYLLGTTLRRASRAIITRLKRIATVLFLR